MSTDDHTHGPDCGHVAIRHDDHVDHLHEGELHHEHPEGRRRHALSIGGANPAGAPPWRPAAPTRPSAPTATTATRTTTRTPMAPTAATTRCRTATTSTTSSTATSTTRTATTATTTGTSRSSSGREPLVGLIAVAAQDRPAARLRRRRAAA